MLALSLTSSANALSYRPDAHASANVNVNLNANSNVNDNGNGNANAISNFPSWSQLLPHHATQSRSIFGLRHTQNIHKHGDALMLNDLLRIRGGSSPQVLQPESGSGEGSGSGPYNSTMEYEDDINGNGCTSQSHLEDVSLSLPSSTYAIETTTHHVRSMSSSTTPAPVSSENKSIEVTIANGTLQVSESEPSPITSTSTSTAVETTTTTKIDEAASLTLTNEDEYKKALYKTILTVASAALFGIAIMATRGVSSGYEFYAGYLIEQSLSIDNLFVFIMLFDYFDIPMGLQNRVLSWGIWGAILLRGLMIGVGVKALQQFRSVILVFAGILIASSVNLLLEKEHEHEASSGDGHGKDDENIIMKVTKFIFPHTTTELHGEAFFIQDPNSVKKRNIATPLFLCLVCVELSDFVFAVDSIPAVLGVSKDPLIVYASNIFAILALRSLYTVVAKAVSSFHYLKPAVAMVLGFVGVKMVAEYFHYEIGTGASLAVICSILGTGIGASVWKNKRDLESEMNVSMNTLNGDSSSEDYIGQLRQEKDHGLVMPA